MGLVTGFALEIDGRIFGRMEEYAAGHLALLDCGTSSSQPRLASYVLTVVNGSDVVEICESIESINAKTAAGEAILRALICTANQM